MDILTVTEAAKVYDCTRENMWHLLRTGRLPYTRVGSVAVIRKEDLDNLLANRDARERPTEWIEAA